MVAASKAAVLALGAALLLGACARGGITRLEETQVPIKARSAIAALSMRLQGHDATATGDRLAVAGAERIAPEPGFSYRDLGVRQVKLTRLENTAGDADATRVAGYLHFEDAVGRRAAGAFDITYRATRAGIAMQDATWRPLYPKTPKLAMFVVPAAAFAAAREAADDSYRTLYLETARRAIDMSDPSAAPGGPADYALVVFVLDRLAADARFRVLTGAAGPIAADDRPATGGRLFDNGWPVAWAEARLALDRADKLWVKAAYVRGAAVPPAERQERVIGLYSVMPR